MENEKVLDKTIGDFSKKADIIQTIILALIAFLAPTFLAQLIKEIFGVQSVITSNSQIIVGSIVNTALIISAINVKGWKKIAAIVTMPSVSTIMSGYIFKTASVFMVYMIPAIWLGNFALIYAFKTLMLGKNKNYFLSGIVGIISKVAIIFGCFSILGAFGVFPEKVANTLKVAMSTTQAITATVGMIIAFGIYQVEKRNIKE